MNLLALMYGLIAVAELAVILWVWHRLMNEQTVNRLIAASHSSALNQLPEVIEPRVVNRDRGWNYEVALFGPHGEITGQGYRRQTIVLTPNIPLSVMWEALEPWGRVLRYRCYPIQRGWPEFGGRITDGGYVDSAATIDCEILMRAVEATGVTE